jgi:hypothetical protein
VNSNYGNGCFLLSERFLQGANENLKNVSEDREGLVEHVKSQPADV